jgi:small GTP-binding protein
MLGEELRLVIHDNLHPSESTIILASRTVSVAALKRDVAARLGISKPQKVFLASGQELESVDSLRDNDHLYVSSGEPFYRQAEEVDNSVLRVAILGAGGVGKSAITLRFVRDFFVQNWEATIEDAYRKTMRVGKGEVVTLEILDTAGQEDFSSLRPQWMTDKEGYIFVYSLVDKDSLEYLHSFVELLEMVCMGLPSAPPIVIVGNKKDLTDSDPRRRAVNPEDVARLIHACERAGESIKAQRPPGSEDRHDGFSVLHFETSALSGEKVEEMFEVLVREIRERRDPAAQVRKGRGRAGQGKSFFETWCSVL